MNETRFRVKENVGLVGEVSERLNGNNDLFFAERLRQFLSNPYFFKPPAFPDSRKEGGKGHRQRLRDWMQDVYNELGIECQVPLPPVLTSKQRKSFQKFDFCLFYIPAITETQYPLNFQKLHLDQWHNAERVECPILSGRWVAVEMIQRPTWGSGRDLHDNLCGSLKIHDRFGFSWEGLHDGEGVLSRIAELIGSSKKKTRLPTAEEWIFLANLFSWLNTFRGEELSDFRTTQSYEWVENSAGGNSNLMIGRTRGGKFPDVTGYYTSHSNATIFFRVLVEL